MEFPTTWKVWDKKHLKLRKGFDTEDRFNLTESVV